MTEAISASVMLDTGRMLPLPPVIAALIASSPTRSVMPTRSVTPGSAPRRFAP